jgi:hypothetical protein
MSDSILTSTKKILGIEADYTAFDFDIITHINSAFATLTQLGVGPEDGFMIEDATPTWDAFLGTDPRLNPVKQYVYLRVRAVFDPPQSSYAVEAMKEQIREHEWRLNVHMEQSIWTDPTVSVPTDDEEVVLDGGGA